MPPALVCPKDRLRILVECTPISQRQVQRKRPRQGKREGHVERRKGKRAKRRLLSTTSSPQSNGMDGLSSAEPGGVSARVGEYVERRTEWWIYDGSYKRKRHWHTNYSADSSADPRTYTSTLPSVKQTLGPAPGLQDRIRTLKAFHGQRPIGSSSRARFRKRVRSWPQASLKPHGKTMPLGPWRVDWKPLRGQARPGEQM